MGWVRFDVVVGGVVVVVVAVDFSEWWIWIRLHSQRVAFFCSFFFFYFFYSSFFPLPNSDQSQ